ncbi:hypothetical protein VTJ49DRAFT_1785 [Mycothermus thermophilus]|uniref:Zn(2)-C6 fungal-type domain-containing protein n=1 Tax=Humicola insolens TaxID=85995 RepID=A0ABR3VBU3_HUMIN
MGAIPPQQPLPGGDALGDAASKPKRARASRPKVKTGCNNCKQRRIRCDERRPECANCVRSKRICPGYPPPPRRPGVYEEIKIAPKALAPVATTALPPPLREPIQLPPRRVSKYHRRTTPPKTPPEPNPLALTLVRGSSLPSSPSLNLPFTDQEAQYFHLFREHTASELSGFFDSAFWTRSVLQECHSATAIRHAVIALGALYKTLDKTNESPPTSPPPAGWVVVNPADTAQRHWEMAFRQYSHACNALVKADAAATTSHRTRLMASVLLACFDSFVGEPKQAIVQIQTGLSLLERLRAEQRRRTSSTSATSDEPVEEELTQMFTRLAIQAKSYDMAFHFPHPWVVRLTSTQAQDPASPEPDGDALSPASTTTAHGSSKQETITIPERFASVMEARLVWDRLLERLLRFTETMFLHAQSGVMGVLPASLRQHGASFKRNIDAWSAAFDPILASRTAPGVSSQEKAAIAVLKMFQIMTIILLMMTFSDSEMHFDNFTPYFRAIVDLAFEVVGDEERRAAARRCPNPAFCHHQSRCHPPTQQQQQHHPQHQRQHSPLFDDGVDDMLGARHIKPSFSADLGIVPPLYVVATKCRDPRLRRQAIRLLRSSARREGMWDSELTARIAMWIAEVEEEGLMPSGGDVFAQQAYAAATIPTPGSSPVKQQSQLGLSPVPTATTAITPPTNPPHTLLERHLQQLRHFQQQQQQQQQEQYQQHPTQTAAATPSPSPVPNIIIPEEKRVMVRAAEFDLRKRTAVIQLGSRNLKTGMPDLKTRVTRITW